jgi:nucleotide-binding universal stress UspA family protein
MSSGSIQRWCDPRVILLATNLHDPPDLMRHAVAEARRSGARLLLVHVIPPHAPQEDAAGSPPRVFLFPSADCAANALEQLALQLQWQGVLCEAVVLRGRPAEQICALVPLRKVDRVFVASRGRAAGASAGPCVAEELASALAIPVCVVSSQADPAAMSGARASRVLLALSLRSMRREYVDFAFGVARARGARLTLLHVLEGSSIRERHRASAHDRAMLRLAALAATCDARPRGTDLVVRDGDPAAQIVEQAGCPFQDLIVLGSSSLRSSSAMLGANILRRVIAEARCPVITLKPPIAEFRAEPDPEWPILRTGSFD